MAKRKVQVDLILDAHNYIDESAKAAAATRALEGATEDLGAATDATSADLREISKNTDFASKSTRDFRNSTHELDTAIKSLDMRIDAARLSVKDLGKAYADSGGDEGIGKQLEAQHRMITQLGNLREELKKAKDEAEKLANAFDGNGNNERDAGPGWFRRLIQSAGAAGALAAKGFADGFSGLPLKGILISILVGAAIVAAPLLGAIIGGAIAGGIGTLGVAAGIYAATKDARVQSGLADLGARVKKEFFDAGAAFVGPVLSSIGVLSHALGDIKFGETLQKAAPFVEIIVTGLADLLRNIMPGLNKTMDRLGPFARVAAEGFGEMGDALGGFLDDVTRSPGAVEGLKAAFMLVEGVVRVLGKAIFYLSEAYDWLLDKAYAAAIALATLADAIPGMSGLGDAARHVGFVVDEMRNVPGAAGSAAGALDAVTGGTQSFGAAAWYAAMKVGDLSRAWDVLHGKFATADETLLAAKKGLKDVADTFAHGGKQVQGSTVAILENRVALEQQAQKAAAAAEAYFKLTGDAAGAQKIMDDQRVAAEKATGATGNNAKAVHDLAVELFTLPPFVETTVKVNVTRYVWTKYVTTGNAPEINANLNLEDRLLGGRATGGPVSPGLWKVGERGPEYLEMGAGQYGYVHPEAPAWTAAASSAPAGGWQGGGGGYASPPVNLTVNLIDSVTGAVTRSMLITDALNRNQSAATVRAAYP